MFPLRRPQEHLRQRHHLQPRPLRKSEEKNEIYEGYRAIEKGISHKRRLRPTSVARESTAEGPAYDARAEKVRKNGICEGQREKGHREKGLRAAADTTKGATATASDQEEIAVCERCCWLARDAKLSPSLPQTMACTVLFSSLETLTAAATEHAVFLQRKGGYAVRFGGTQGFRVCQIILKAR
jgi:hypothetical protein